MDRQRLPDLMITFYFLINKLFPFKNISSPLLKNRMIILDLMLSGKSSRFVLQ